MEKFVIGSYEEVQHHTGTEETHATLLDVLYNGRMRAGRLVRWGRVGVLARCW